MPPVHIACAGNIVQQPIDGVRHCLFVHRWNHQPGFSVLIRISRARTQFS